MLRSFASASVFVLVGCSGSDGADGSVGAPGPVGPAGVEGPAGAPGASGAQRVFGDGSAGALDVTADTTFSATVPADGNLAFSSIRVAPGVVLTVPSGVVLRATGKVDIQGTISVQPFAIGRRTDSGSPGVARSGCAPGFFGPSAVAGFVQNLGGVGLGADAARYGLPSGAAGGGSGCSEGETLTKGGGRVTIVAGDTISVGAQAVIRANGETPSTNNVLTGGGGGGIVILGSASAIEVTGTIEAKGGSAHASRNVSTQIQLAGGAGGGGGILFFAPTVSSGQATLDVSGGTAPAIPALVGLYVNSYVAGGGGGGSIGSGGASVTYSTSGGGSIARAGDGQPGAVLVQKTHPANSHLF